MSRLRSSIVTLGLLAACRALPSAIPLADTGEGRPEDGALGRNRVSQSARTSGPSGSDDDGDADETVTIVASVADAGDAGPPEGGVTAADAGDAGGRWAGEYFGSDRHTRSIKGTKEVELDDKAHTRVEEPSPGVALFSLVSSASGEVICGMRARVTGDRAELEPGASCAPLDLKPPLALKGSATLEGDELELEIEGHGEFPVGDESIELDVEYHFEGKRR